MATGQLFEMEAVQLFEMEAGQLFEIESGQLFEIVHCSGVVARDVSCTIV